jgi:Alginate export
MNLPQAKPMLIVLLGLASACWSATAVAAPDPCLPQTYRFDDDCKGLSNREPLQGLDRLRYIPLASDGSTWMTFGGEVRARAETLDPPNFGVGPADRKYTAKGFRVFGDADVRTNAGWRLFVQMSAASETGRQPAERGFDRSAIDVAQLFVDVPIAGIGDRSFLRVGRQEIDLSSTRLVGPREQANLRLAFDMARLQVNDRGVEFVTFWGRPVANMPGAFDDKAPSSESLFGVTVRARPRVAEQVVLLDMLLLGRDRDHTTWVDSAGPERRRMFTLAASTQAGLVDMGFHATYQFGKSGASDISAYGVVGSLGYRFADTPWKPHIGVDFGVASGDRKRGDGKLNSFDPLYPNLGYFTDAPVDFPSNWQGIQPSLTLAPREDVSVRVGTDIRFRQSRSDGIYATSGRAFIGADTPGGDFVDFLTFAHITWRATRYLQFDFAYVHGTPRKVVIANGGGAFNYGMVEAVYKF